MKKSALLMTMAFVTGMFGATHLKVGDKAPDFTLTGTKGEVKLADLQGKTVVVGFFPAAFTGG